MSWTKRYMVVSKVTPRFRCSVHRFTESRMVHDTYQRTTIRSVRSFCNSSKNSTSSPRKSNRLKYVVLGGFTSIGLLIGIGYCFGLKEYVSQYLGYYFAQEAVKNIYPQWQQLKNEFGSILCTDQILAIHTLGVNETDIPSPDIHRLYDIKDDSYDINDNNKKCIAWSMVDVDFKAKSNKYGRLVLYHERFINASDNNKEYEEIFVNICKYDSINCQNIEKELKPYIKTQIINKDELRGNKTFWEIMTKGFVSFAIISASVNVMDETNIPIQT